MTSCKLLPRCCNKPKSRSKQCFLGKISFLNKHSPRLTEPGDILRELTKMSVPFLWEPEHMPKFQCHQARNHKSSDTQRLQCSQATSTSTESCIKKAFATILFQINHLIIFASKSLQIHQKSYSTTDLEACAVT